MPRAGSEVALVPASDYAITKMDAETREVLDANIGGGQVGTFDLERIKVPTGGGLTWEIGDEAAREIQAVVVGWADQRTYWKESFGASGGGTPPDCVSRDLLLGEGDPGGPCVRCRYNQWGTAVRQDGSAGRGKACRESRLLLLMRPEEILPTLLVIPPSSLKAVRRYFMRLASRRVPYFGVTTRLSLTKTKSGDGIDYAEIKCSEGEVLSAASRTKMREVASLFAPTLEAVVVESAEVGAEA